ncbi:MAG TPA: ornithine cyclodeaminase family protein [Candidatus Baltobacteraceae bacterium]|nr:ornithine cyclodeaminase family protein [Candidatus Baltobacteraceae bacterium]
MLILSEHDVNELLTMPECIDVMHRLFATLATANFVQPLRLIACQPDRRGGIAAMPAFVGTSNAIGAKLITVFPQNRKAGLDSHQGIVALHETQQGRLLGIFHAGAVTEIRTAAVSGMATRLLAREDAGDLAILGSGAQARSHLQAMRSVRTLRRVRVWSRTTDNAQAFASWASGDVRGIEIRVCVTPEEAVCDADLICTVTAATQPVLQGAWLTPGAHINAAGASVPGFRELDTDAIMRSRLFVDSRESALAEADDIRAAISEGRVDTSHIAGDLPELASGRVPGRRNADEVTLFESCGMAIEDVAAVAFLYERATALGRGTTVEF